MHPYTDSATRLTPCDDSRLDYVKLVPSKVHISRWLEPKNTIIINYKVSRPRARARMFTTTMDPMMRKHAIVIGAGPSGLCAIKELTEKGHTVTCLEKSGQIGGVFARDASYDSLCLTISNLLMTFSDFPRKDGVKYWSKQEYTDYLEDYTDYFGLRKNIEMNTQVVKAKLNKRTGKWTVQTKNTKNNKTKHFNSDVLICATGSNHTPKMIDLPGFNGGVSHSITYRGAEPFRGKRVLTIGVGESSSDIATEAAEVAESVTVYSRRFNLLAPRFLYLAIDLDYHETETLATQGEGRKDKVNMFLECITTNRLSGWLPPWWFVFIRQLIWMPRPKGGSIQLIADWCRYATEGSSYFRADQIGVATKNAKLSVAHSLGKINSVVSSKIAFDGKKVLFLETVWDSEKVDECETSIEVDHIVLCTGFKTDFSWIDVGGDQDFHWCPRSWYKHCFPSGDLGLCFWGGLARIRVASPFVPRCSLGILHWF